MDTSWEATAKFLGHTCPGLAHGYRASMAAMAALACGVDAVQSMTGCTIGKGNLVLLNYGKPGHTFYSRRRGSAVRIVVDGGMPPDPRSDEALEPAPQGAGCGHAGTPAGPNVSFGYL